MSLFKTREWWSVDLNTNELFSPESFRLAQFKHLTGKDTDLIITGSLSGNIRIYNPYPVQIEGSDQLSGPENLILETNLGKPILQLSTGRLSSNDNGPQIAVLHPRLLSIYSLERGKGKFQEFENYKLQLLYQHNLSRSAFSLTIGPFGRVKNRDFMCVQSIDGTLNLFEQESFSFSRFLPGFLLPGPIEYAKRTDSFVTVSSSHQLESYRYETLAVATDVKGKETENISSGKRLAADWVLGLGESGNSLKILTSDSDSRESPHKIVVLGVRTLFVLFDTGVIIFSKKLDYAPIELLSYYSGSGMDKVISLVATETQTILIYDNTSLKWATQAPFVPMALRKGTFQDGENTLKHVLVLMSKKGDLFLGFLGTDPTLFSAPPDTRTVNYDETDQEFSQLNKSIKAFQTSESGSQDLKSGGRENLDVIVEVSGHLERCYHTTMVSDEDGVPMARVVITHRTNMPLNRIRMSIDVAPPLASTHSSIIVNSLTDSHISEVYCYLYENFVPHTLDLTVTSVYFTDQGVPTILSNVIQLPLRLIVKPCSPIKDADYKITISSNKPAVSLLDIFPEFVLDSTMANAAGLQYLGGPVVTVLSSKTSQRYRLQSDNLPSLWIILQSLEKRLQKRFSRNKQEPPLELSYSSSLPLHEYFTEIESHFQKRAKLKIIMHQLSERAAQFRSIERRLLTRFKDKTPTPLTNLDTLLEATYRQVLQATERVEHDQMQLSQSSCNLSCITNLLLFLVRLMTGMNEAEASKIESALSPVVHQSQEQGWEETIDAALTFLLRTSLAKAGKENQGATPITLEAAKDSSRIRKHISSVMDRIVKGGRVHDNRNPVEETELMDFSRTTPSDEIEDEPGNPWDESNTPVGSHFGESGDRIRSAKIRGKTSTLSRGNDPDKTCHDHTDEVIQNSDDVINGDQTGSDFAEGNEVDRDEDLLKGTNGDNDDEGSDDEDGEGW